MSLKHFSILSGSLLPGCRVLLALVGILLLSACGGGDGDQGEDSPTTARTVPQNIAITTGTRINELNWSGVNGASGYTVYWSTEPNVSTFVGTPVNTQQPNFVHTGLANGTTYYYVITSTTGFGESLASTPVEGTPQAAPPAAPGDLELHAGNGRITLRWDAVPGATHYTLYWKNSAGVSTDDARIDRVASPFVHHGLENGRDYFYRLVAENEQGASDGAMEKSAAPVLSLPAAPQITQAEVASGQVILHWQHAGIASQYELYWSLDTALSEDASENNTSLTWVTSPYVHAPLQDGRAYYYRLRAHNSAGASALSNPVRVTPPGDVQVDEPGSVPAAPTDITVSLEDGQLSLDWAPVDGALGYNLYWLSGETGEVDTGSERLSQIQPPYTHIQLNNNTLYRYRLSAFNDHGESALSAEVNGVPQVIIPGVPAGVQALAGDESILVRWNPVQDAAGYVLTIDGQTHTEVTSPYPVTGLINARPYQIQLQAQNAGGLSEPSEPVNATPREPVPNPPQELVAQSANAAVLLQWKEAIAQNVDDLDEAVTGYRVYYATHAGVRLDNGIPVDAAATPTGDGRWQLSHTSLQNGQTYYYVISALNAGGESQLSKEVWARPRVPTPGVPAGLSAEAGDGQVLINFTPLDNAPSSTYNLYWTRALDDGRSTAEVISNVQLGFRFSDGANSNGNTYFFQVSAVTDGNESPLSDEVSATPQVPAPEQAPQNVQALTDSSRVTLSWDPVQQASGYVIYWSTESDISPQTSHRLSGEAIQPGFVHDQLDDGESYFYRVAAINAGGEGALSELLVAQPQVPPPSTPAGFSVQPGDGQVAIGFELAPTASHYHLFWHTDVEVPLAQWSSRAVQSGDVVADLENGQSYAFVLQASNAGGSSPLTTSIGATPQPDPPATPTGLAIIPGDGVLDINWHTQPGLSYNLYWSDDPGIAPGDSGNVLIDIRPTYRHTGLANNTAYHYQVSASNSGGEGALSEPVQDTPREAIPSNENQVPQITQGELISVTLDEDSSPTPFALTLSASDDDGDALDWFIATQASLGSAGITGNNTSANVSYVPDANINGRDTFTVQVSDGQGGTDSIQVEVNITPQNDAPLITNTDLNLSVAENMTVVTAIAVTDIDSATFSYTLSGEDSALFSMNGDTLNFTNAPDFENPQDSGADNIYNVSVTANDGTHGSAATAFTVSVNDLNDEAPLITNTNLAPEVDENTVTVTTITTTDADSSAFTYLLSGADSALFNMTGSSLSFLNAPDSEMPQDNGADNVYNVTVIANDGTNNSAAKDFTIRVNNLNDEAPVITNTSLDLNMAENATAVTAITVTDADSTAFSYTLSGVDSALFSMNNNTLNFIDAPDFNVPQDSDADNVYNVSVTASDGINSSAAKAFAITITDANDSAPVITNTDLSPAVVENTTTVAAIEVTDVDSTVFTYTVGGEDSAQFNMSGNTLRFVAAPDFESPQDSGADNIYNVTVTANDGVNDSEPKAFTITVTDINDSVPVITNTDLNLNVAENTTKVTTISVSDADTVSSPFSYLLSGPDSGRFSMSGETLNFTTAPDFESPQDSGADNVYNITITASDGIHDSAATDFAVTVIDVDELPPVITLNGSDSVSIFQHDAYIEPGASAVDDRDGPVNVTISGTVDTSTVGSYTVTYSATDAAGNTATATRTVNVEADTTPPVITLNGSNPVSVIQNDPYIEEGASAVDNRDGTVNVTISDNVDTSAVGSYTVTYSATDAAGNTATANRTVNVVNNGFITTWKTDNPGISDDNQIMIKTSGEGYNYRVDWGDGQVDLNVTGDITHTYATAGIYAVSISGDFPRIVSDIDFNDENNDAEKMLSVEQWGNIAWQSMSVAFSGCINLVVNAGDAPDLSRVTDMAGMFAYAAAFNQDINHWDVSAVTHMQNMFSNATSFNQDLSNWNTSAVTDMFGMFHSATSFNQDLSNWDVSSVKYMYQMFRNATTFNQNLSTWDVSAVIVMGEAFSFASSFNQDLSSWNVSAVTDMSRMFYHASSFNQDLSNWDVSAVTSMEQMFSNASSFNQNLGNWDVSAVEDMRLMFSGVTLSTANYDALLLGWSAQNLRNNVIFDGGNSQYSSARQANRDILTGTFGWTVTDGGVVDEQAPVITLNGVDPITIFQNDAYLEEGASAIDDQDGNVDVIISGVVDTSTVGSYTVTYSATDTAGNTATVTRTVNVVADTISPVITLNGSNSISIFQYDTYIEEGASATDNRDGTVNVITSGTVDTETVGSYTVTYSATDAAGNTATATRTVNVEADTTPPIITLNGSNPVSVSLNDAYIEEGASAVDNRDGTVNVTISDNVDTSTVGSYTVTYSATDAAGNTATANRTVNVVNNGFITTWKTDNPGISDDNQIMIKTSGEGYNYSVDWGDGQTDFNVTGDITHTYATAGIYTVSISGDFPRIVFGLDFNNEDNDAEKLLSIEQWGDIAWQSMNSAFTGCANLVVNASDAPDLSRVTDMSYMFAYAYSLNQDLSNWDVSSVTNMSYLFLSAFSFNQDLSSWDVSAVTSMEGTFFEASSFNQDLSSWVVSAVTDMSGMFAFASTFNQVLSWDVSSVESMETMFAFAFDFNQELSWDVSAVTDMSAMFAGASAFNQELIWDVSAVTDMNSMFQGASAFNQDLSSWDVSAVTDMNGMFINASVFDQDLGRWDVSSVTSMEEMFSGVTLSTTHYDALLLGWSAQSLQSGVPFSAGSSRYSIDRQVNRDILTEAFGWTVTDGGLDE